MMCYGESVLKVGCRQHVGSAKTYQGGACNTRQIRAICLYDSLCIYAVTVCTPSAHDYCVVQPSLASTAGCGQAALMMARHHMRPETTRARLKEPPRS
jgi:hypothetical protein